MNPPKRLSQKECDKLPVGTKVIVTWSGGNGPHEYTVVRHWGGVSLVDTAYDDPLDFVGQEFYHTAVWLK